MEFCRRLIGVRNSRRGEMKGKGAVVCTTSSKRSVNAAYCSPKAEFRSQSQARSRPLIRICLVGYGHIVFDFLGWSSKTFRATNLSLRPDGAIDAVFTEEQSGDWTDLVAGDYNTQSITPLPAQNATTPSAPSSFAISEQINGTILFTLGTPIIRPLGTQYQIIRSTNSVNAAVGTVVYEGTNNTVPLVMPTSTHWYWARSICNSLASEYAPNTFGIVARSTGEATPRYAKDLTQDPEFSMSSEMGRFFVHSRSDVYSISLSGGQQGGRLIVNIVSKGISPADYFIFIPNSPFQLFVNFREIVVTLRARPIVSLPTSADYVFGLFRVFAWNGVATPSSLNYTILSTTPSATS